MANKRQALGRGFDSLIPTELDRSILDEDKSRVQKILITDIVPNPAQPRGRLDEIALSELADSIKRHGVLQPIIVIHDRAKKTYQIVAGERRWRAAKAAKLTHVPAIVRSLAELEQIEIALIENIQRQDLSPLEQALAVFKLQHQFNLKLDEIAAKLGKAPSTISNLARLLELPDAARQALQEGKISEGHARAVLALKNKPALQQELLSCILNNGWTVRQAEQFVVAAKKGAGADRAKKHTVAQTTLTRRISQQLNAPVTIYRTARGGELRIGFDNDEQLQQLAEKLTRKTK
ncbi:ParB/RepB/Spo0J family partition protein [Candidatus Saccharibacteria bacterium]|nr:ParB/RepB/Spo0J family partition protein [Candidatus Saccharibacteria bacterium]